MSPQIPGQRPTVDERLTDANAKSIEEQAARAVSSVKRVLIRGGTRERGLMNAGMDGPVNYLKLQRPEKVTRWVYMPEHTADFRRLIAAQMRGYTLVSRSEFPDMPLPFGTGAGDFVRCGDSVLCWIDAELHAEEVAHLQTKAEEDRDRPKQAYREAIRRKYRPEHARAGGDVRYSTEEHDLSAYNEESKGEE